MKVTVFTRTIQDRQGRVKLLSVSVLSVVDLVLRRWLQNTSDPGNFVSNKKRCKKFTTGNVTNCKYLVSLALKFMDDTSFRREELYFAIRHITHRF